MLERDDDVVVFGEDVGYFGGVFRCTEGLQAKYGAHRVFDTPIAEGGIIGVAVGMGAYGLRPVAEIQFADYVYPGLDQLISEAARLRYRSGAEFTAPITVRMPVGGGIHGGQTHSQSPESLFTHVCGLKTVHAVDPVRRQGAADRGDRGRRSGDLPRAQAAVQRSVRRPSRPARSCRGQAHPLGDVPDGHYSIPLGQRRRAPRRGTTSRSSPTARWCTWPRRPPTRPAIDAEIIDLRTLLPLDTDTIERVGAQDRPVRDRPRGDADERVRCRAVGDRAGALLLRTSRRPSSGSPAGTRRTRTRRSGTTSPARPGWAPRLRPGDGRLIRRCDERVRVQAARRRRGVAEAEIVEWHVAVGDTIGEDDVIADVMTDKATVELPSPVDGVVALARRGGRRHRRGRHRRWCGSTSTGRRRAADARRQATDAVAPAEPGAEGPGSADPTARGRQSDGPRARQRDGAGRAAGDRHAGRPGAAPRRSKRDRGRWRHQRCGRERGRWASNSRRRPAPAPTAGSSTAISTPCSSPRERPAPRHHDVDRAGPRSRTTVEAVKVTGLRRNIAERMQAAKRRIPHFTYVEEVDVTEVERLRRELNDAASEAQPKLTLLPFLMRAVVRAVADHPRDERPVRRRGRRRRPPPRRPPRHRRADRAGLDGARRQARRSARHLGSRAAEVARLADAARDGEDHARRADRLDDHHHQPRRARRHRRRRRSSTRRRSRSSASTRSSTGPCTSTACSCPRQIMNLSSSFDHRVIDGCRRRRVHPADAPAPRDAGAAVRRRLTPRSTDLNR